MYRCALLGFVPSMSATSLTPLLLPSVGKQHSTSRPLNRDRDSWGWSSIDLYALESTSGLTIPSSAAAIEFSLRTSRTTWLICARLKTIDIRVFTFSSNGQRRVLRRALGLLADEWTKDERRAGLLWGMVARPAALPLLERDGYTHGRGFPRPGMEGRPLLTQGEGVVCLSAGSRSPARWTRYIAIANPILPTVTLGVKAGMGIVLSRTIGV